MRRVEQAVYTSIEQGGRSGYQVVARSPGICDADARELRVWSPSGDAMLDPSDESESFNFHPLPSGAFCIARSTTAGWEHRGGRRMHTHCLIVGPEILDCCDNHPFALIRAVSDGGLWQNPHAPTGQLEPLCLPEKAVEVDQALLRRLAVDPGPDSMAALVQQARHAVCLAIDGAARPETLIAGLFDCLPPECRLEFSFSTGLRFSPWRPFHIVALSGDTAERLWVASYSNVTVLEVGGDVERSPVPLDGWATLVERALASDHIPFLASQVSRRRPDLTLHDLPALGLQLLEGLDHSHFADNDPAAEQSTALGRRAHAAHRKFQKSGQTSPMATLEPSVDASRPKHSELHAPEVLDKLEQLDDLVYEAISGQADAIEKLYAVWPRLLDELGEDALVESREQYLRHALSVWTDCVHSGAIRDPTRAIQALDVLCLLFGESARS